MNNLKKYFPIAFYLMAAAIRLFDLGKADFWYDEAFSVMAASKDVFSMIAATAGDTHPPLYYLVIYPIVHLFGPSTWLVRLPSAILSVVGIWLVGRLADRIGFSNRARWVAMVIMALSPMELHFAQEARMYALFQALVLGWLLAVLNRRWRLAAVLGCLTMYTHNYSLFYLPVVALVGLAGEVKRPVVIDTKAPAFGWRPGDEANLRGWFMSVMVPALAWLPWQIVLLGQMSTVASGYWIQPVTPGSVLYALYMLWWGFAPFEVLQPLAAMVCFGLMLYSLIRVRSTLSSESARVLLLLALVPLALACGMSVLWKPVLLFRGLIASAPAFYMMAATVLASGKPWRLVYAGVLILPVMIPSIFSHYLYNPINKGDVYSFMNVIRAEWQPGDVVYQANDGGVPVWSVYAPDMPQVLMPECKDHNLGALSPTTRQALGLQVVAPDAIEHRRVWLIWSAGPTSTACEEDAVTRLVSGVAPRITIRNDEYVSSAIWLLEDFHAR